MTVDPQRLKELFLHAADIVSPSERAAFLDRECGNDAELRRKLEALLHAHDDSGGFLAPGPTSDPTPSGDEQPHADSTDAAGDVIGPYKLLQKLGEGGMGTVWVAEQHQPVKRRVALKLIKPGMDSAQILRRFEAERQALALMDHTSIAKVFDAGTTTQGRPFFVMELVKGVPITKYCDELNLPIRERLALFVPVCQAIQHAHQKGIIHRDIKPSNVLVCMQDGKPVPKIIDFGIAKATSQRLTDASLYTEVGQVIGTLEYMSPEQAELSALDIDTRADVYALGAMLYELLTGTTPLDRQRLKQAALIEVLRLIKEQEPPRPSTRLSESKETLPSIAAQRRTEPARLTKEVRGELDWIVMKCLEKDRTRRYETANALARDVERYLADEPVEACPPNRSYRFRKSVHKHWKLLATALLFALVFILCSVVTAWQAVLARAAEKQAQIDKEDAQSAQKRAQNEAARAERQAATVQAFADFFSNDLLFLDDTVNPRSKGNEELLVVVNRMARKLEGQFQDQPEVEFLLRDRIYAVYETLHRFAAARPHLERELMLCRQLYGEEDEDTLLLKNRLAELSAHLGEYARAESLFLSCLEASRQGKREFPTEERDTLQSLAEVYLAMGKYDRAEAILRDNLRRIQDEEGEEQANLADEMIDLGDVYRAQGKYDRAEEAYRKVWNARRRSNGVEGPRTMKVLAALAEFYQAQKKYDQVELLFKDQIEGWGLGFLTEEDTARGLDALAASRLARNKYPEAEEALRRSVEIWQEVFPDGWRYSDALSLLGGALLGQKKYTDAEPLLRQGYQGMNQRQAQIPVQYKAERLHQALQRLVQLYEATGNKDEAAKWRKELQALQAKKPGGTP